MKFIYETKKSLMLEHDFILEENKIYEIDEKNIHYDFIINNPKCRIIKEDKKIKKKKLNSKEEKNGRRRSTIRNRYILFIW